MDELLDFTESVSEDFSTDYFITAGDWDCVVTVKSPLALHHSVDFIFYSFEIIDSILEL